MQTCRTLRSSGALLRAATRAAGRLAVAIVAAFASGCYYGHLARGQMALLWAREPVPEVLARKDTPAAVRRRLALAQSVRAFAAEIGLAVDGQYTSYVPWEGDRLVTTLVRTRPGRVEPDDFHFPLVGALPYKGYFDSGRALEEAAHLRAEGFDVCVSPVVAYSTLGWVDDPLTGPMLRSVGSDDELVETLVHELVHANAYWPDDPDLAESLATFTGEEAAVAFFEARGEADAAARARARVEDDRRIAAVVLALRNAVEALYASAGLAGEGVEDGADPPALPAAVAEERAILEARARARLAALDLAVRPAAQVAELARLSDACLALRGTYAADLPAQAALFEARGRDLRAWIARLRALADDEAPRERWFGGS